MRWLLLCLLPCPLWADTVVTSRVIKAGTIIQADDLAFLSETIPGTLSDPADIAGQEARVALYPGRPIRADQVGAPAIVMRNQVVPLVYLSGSIAITTEGRVLGRGGIGDIVSVLNLSSRATVQGKIQPDGTVRVDPSER